MSDWMSAAEVADRLGISVSAVHRLANRGTLPYCRCGLRKVFRRSVISEFERDAGYLRRRRAPLTDRQARILGQMVLEGFGRCGAYLPDGRLCGWPASFVDKRRGVVLCEVCARGESSDA